MAYPILGSSSQYPAAEGYSPSKLGKRTDEEKAKDCVKYLLVLAQQRIYWEPQIDNILRFVNHGRRGIWDKDLWPGMQTGMEIFADSAMLARNQLVDGMVGNIVPRNIQWFALEIPGKLNFPRTSGMRAWNGERVDSYPQVQKWLQESTDVIYSAFNRSNFYDVVPEFISDGATCGTASMVVEEDIRNARINFVIPHFRECFIAEDQFGQVDTNYRVYKMTLRQLAQKFGYEQMKTLEPNFEHEYKSNYEAEREVLHAVYPREDYEPWRIDKYGKKWASMWVYRKGGKLLTVSGAVASLAGNEEQLAIEGGYDTKPIITWRWRKNSDEIYGRGPAHDAWVSIALDNQMGRTNLVTAQKAAEPPLVAYSDLRNAIQRGPNGVTYVESNRGDIRLRAPMELTTGVKSLPFTVEYQDRVKAVINQYFHTDVFMMMSQLQKQGNQSRMVTEQVMELQGEKAAILGTRVGNLQSEALNPLIERVYSIEAAAGRIPTPPDILLEAAHEPVLVQYLGPLSQAQTRLTKVRSITSFLQLATQVAQFDPSVPHYVNSEGTLRILGDAVGLPVECLRTPKEIMQINQAIAKNAQQERMAETVPQLAKAAASLSKAPESGSILKELLGGDNAQ
jgi:hypothetical protein